MSTQTYDARFRDSAPPPLLLLRMERSYYAEVWSCQHDEQSSLIELLIDIVFDTLGAEHLDVRVHPTWLPARDPSL
jgi:hypothetical protein